MGQVVLSTAVRPTLLRIWRALPFRSTTQEQSLETALALVLANEGSRAEWLPLPEASFNLDWVPDTWWRLVTGTAKRNIVDRANRRYFELCVFTQIMWDLKSGDAAIEGSREYADYRDELIGEAEAAALSLAYQEQAGYRPTQRSLLPRDADGSARSRRRRTAPFLRTMRSASSTESQSSPKFRARRHQPGSPGSKRRSEKRCRRHRSSTLLPTRKIC
jgi:hypothetical protein